MLWAIFLALIALPLPAVVPQPQQMELGSSFPFGRNWRLDVSRADAVTAEALRDGLRERLQIILPEQGSGPLLLAEIDSSAPDRDESYEISLAPVRVRLAARTPQGLFYAVSTFLQLASREQDQWRLPQGKIADWPDLPRRHIYWDDAHHLERLSELKRAVRQAAFYKINGFVLKLEGHFEFTSAPAVVEPYALTRADYQELTDYARRYYVELIPYLDAPGHIAFILKHPEYRALRAFPESNYELCMANPEAVSLIQRMFGDLLAANRGGKYVYLSTDEAYYSGMADHPACREKDEAARAGSPGKLLAEFIAKVADPMHQAGRTVIFWGEHPLKPADIAALPPYLVNGETGGPEVDALYKARGLRQMIYTSCQGEERLFPDYFVLPAERRLHADKLPAARPQEIFQKIAHDPARPQGNIIGVLNAGWADAGLHPETFWGGYVTAAAAAWNPTASPDATLREFFAAFYGDTAIDMERVYRLMSWQAQAWTDSWESEPSTARKPIFGNSQGPFATPRPVHDPTLPLTGLGTYEWRERNRRRTELAAIAARENAELLDLLNRNLAAVRFNHYNLEVLRTIANLYRHNWDLLRRLAALESPADIPAARAAIEEDRARVLRGAEEVWYRSWEPRVAEANRRRFLHELDDVKDHLPDRTVDLSYLVYRELQLRWP